MNGATLPMLLLLDCPVHACHLFYRPLREGDGDGDAPPWTVETFDDSDARGGPAFDELSELARGGGRWLAFIANSEDGGLDRILGEFVVRDGAAWSVPPWSVYWAIARWERSLAVRAIDMLDAPSMPLLLHERAALACWRIALELAPNITQADRAAAAQADEAWGERSSRENDIVNVIEGMPLRRSLIRLNSEMRDTDRESKWHMATLEAVRRVVGDAWFIARADVKDGE